MRKGIMEYYDSELLGARVYPNREEVYFYGGIFSQWAECTFFSNVVQEEVNCAEQAMMLLKAMTFNDCEAYDQIKLTDDPRKQKAIGRQIQDFDQERWDQINYAGVISINRDKFSQNKAWNELLLLTDPYDFIEASPYDKIWGIGMGIDNPKLLNVDKWGQNLLGKAITRARNEIIHTELQP